MNDFIKTHDEIAKMKSSLEGANDHWESGKKTAGTHAAEVKNNLQLNKGSDISRKYSDLITKKILSSDLIKIKFSNIKPIL